MKESLSAFGSQSQSASRSRAALPADYVVTNADTAAANGDYYENETFNSVPCYEKSGGGAWLYYSVAGGLPVGKLWAIYSEKLDGTYWYSDQTDGATPTVGTYADGGSGDEPDADVALG